VIERNATAELATGRALELSPALRATAKLLDQRWSLLGIPFGMDAVLGLVPLLGDFVGMLVGLGMVIEAIRLRASWRTVGRMIRNLWLDAVLGAVPIVGDLFDFFFQAHRRNLEILERDFSRS
jgi:hypothetical protein